jgi:hypothetical protein
VTRRTAAALLALTAAACQPKVQVEAPKEPIVINMNIKIEHEVRIKVDREVEQMLNENEDIFGAGR